MLVADKGGELVRRILRSEVVATSGKFVNLRQVSCEATLIAGRTYTIFVSTFNPGEEAAFVLSVHADRPVELFLLTGAPAEREESLIPRRFRAPRERNNSRCHKQPGVPS